MTQESDLKTMVQPLVTNSMIGKVTPEFMGILLWNFVDKMLCKDSEATIQAMLQSEIDALNTEIANVKTQVNSNTSGLVTVSNGLASLLSTVTGHTTQIGALQSGKVDKTTTVNGQPLSGNVTISVPTITQGAAVTNAAVNSPTDAPTNAPTNYGLIAAILGADMNATNAKQNQTASNLNALAANVNAGFAKLNSLITTLKANGMLP